MSDKQMVETKYPEAKIASVDHIKNLYDQLGEAIDKLNNFDILMASKSSEPCVVKEPIVTDQSIEAAIGDIDYLFYEEALKQLLITSTTKAARKNWDNTYNIEYIMSMPNLGLVKIFESSGPHNFKQVKHSYFPSAEDRDIMDWYILNY